MSKVQTKDGERHLVVLTGPASYTIKGRRVERGSVITVTERTRRYLVATGMWRDYDPTPAAEPDPVMGPQFGEQPEKFDAGDFARDNPPLTSDDLRGLAGQAASGGGDAPAEKPEPKGKPRRGGVKVSGAKPTEEAAPAEDDSVVIS